MLLFRLSKIFAFRWFINEGAVLLAAVQRSFDDEALSGCSYCSIRLEGDRLDLVNCPGSRQ